MTMRVQLFVCCIENTEPQRNTCALAKIIELQMEDIDLQGAM